MSLDGPLNRSSPLPFRAPLAPDAGVGETNRFTRPLRPHLSSVEQSGESVKDAPLRRAVRESLTDSPDCSMTIKEGEGNSPRDDLLRGFSFIDVT